MKHWQPREIELLTGLRSRFLAGTAGAEDYWRSDEELLLYDATFAARIGWKIDGVIRALEAINWRPRSTRLLDWGCGSGIASRRVLATWSGFTSAAFVDRSPRAVRFAQGRLRELHPSIQLAAPEADGETLLVISHVLTELPETALEALLVQVRAAGEVIWVESGTHENSRRLIRVRERLLAEGNPHHVVAPCTHQAPCGLLEPENERHWCHHFAAPPQEVYRDARWDEWSKALGIDRRALPFSYLVLTRHPAPDLTGCARVIGVPREGKGHCRVLSCEASGVTEPMLQKRDASALFKLLLKNEEWPPFRWKMEGGKIVGGRAFGTPEAGDEEAP